MAATGQEVERRTSAQSEEGVAQHFSTEFFGLEEITHGDCVVRLADTPK